MSNTIICTDCGWSGDLQQCHWRVTDERPHRPVGVLIDLRCALCPECHKLASLHVEIQPQQGCD
jgi:hypothetical protein